jgi:hypothetical protein
MKRVYPRDLPLRRVGFAIWAMSSRVTFVRWLRIEVGMIWELDVRNAQVGEFTGAERVDKPLGIGSIDFQLKNDFTFALRHNHTLPNASRRLSVISVARKDLRNG